MTRIAGQVVVVLLLTGTLARADFWSDAKDKVGGAVGGIVDKGKQIVNGGVEAAKAVVNGAGKVLEGGAKVLIGHAQEGFKEMGDGVIQVVVSAGVAVVTVADPILGTLTLNGQPSPLQGVAKWIYDVISHWKGKPACNPQQQVDRLMTVPKKTLGDGDRVAGFISTPAKYLSSIFDGFGAWEPTGCDAVGVGRPIRSSQQSTDGLWTVDLDLISFEVQGVKPPQGKKLYIRLEIMPGVDAHRSASDHPPTPNDIIAFGGPMMWDKDTDGDHPSGHMEVHPLGSLQFGAKIPDNDPKKVEPTPPPVSGTGDSPLSRLAPKTDGGSATYTVVKGDCLSTIAERLYGVQDWPLLYRANRTKIKDPDLIYPGQQLVLPPPPAATKVATNASATKH